MEYKKAIKNIVTTLKDKYHPEKIILFGSCVSGNVNNNSDIDMLIVKNTRKQYGQRWLEVCRLVRDHKRHIPFEPFILTLRELKAESKKNIFLQEILQKGKVLYEKN